MARFFFTILAAGAVLFPGALAAPAIPAAPFPITNGTQPLPPSPTGGVPFPTGTGAINWAAVPRPEGSSQGSEKRERQIREAVIGLNRP